MILAHLTFPVIVGSRPPLGRLLVNRECRIGSLPARFSISDRELHLCLTDRDGPILAIKMDEISMRLRREYLQQLGLS